MMDFTVEYEGEIFEEPVKFKNRLSTNLSEASDQIAHVLTTKVQKYMPAGHRLAEGQRRLSTGRLWSSFGTAEKRTNNPQYNPSDRVVRKIIRRGSGSVNVEVGTKVHYTPYANHGIGPGGVRHPYMFLEKGEREAAPIVKNMYDEAILLTLDPKQRQKAGSSFRASTRKRDVLGRFRAIRI